MNRLTQHPTTIALGALPYLAATITVLLIHGIGGLRQPIDFSVYQRIAIMVAGGDKDIYAEFNGLPFTYPPFAAVLFTGCHVVLRATFPWVLCIASIVATVAMVRYLVRWVLPKVSSKQLALCATVISVALLASEPFYRNFGLGQINVLLAALLFFGVVSTRRNVPGICVGLAAGVKLTPAFYGLIFLVRKDWRNAIASVSTGVLSLVVGFVFLTDASKEFWSGTGFDASRVGGVPFAGNQSLNGMFFRMSGAEPNSIVLISAQIAVVVACAVAVWLWRGDLVPSFAVVTVAGLLISPISWSHHWVPAIAVFAVMAYVALNSSGPRKWSATTLLAIGVLAFITHVIWSGEEYNNAELHQGFGFMLAQSTYVIWGLACLVWFITNGKWASNQQAESATETA